MDALLSSALRLTFPFYSNLLEQLSPLNERESVEEKERLLEKTRKAWR
jgi:hypothetical protein